MTPNAIAEAARELLTAERTQRPIEPPSNRHHEMSLQDAYAVQSAYAGLRLAGGARIVGRKIGATSRAIQQQFGVDTPDFGVMFDDMVLEDGCCLSRRELIQPRVEGELAFVLRRPLHGPSLTIAEVLDATTDIIPCLEIIDSRIENWRIRLVDTVADNGSSARCVLGTSRIEPGAFDLARTSMELCRNGLRVAAGTGEAVLGHPAIAVAWLARALGELGAGLEAGDLVLSGSFAAAIACQAGDTFEAVFEPHGKVRCEFTE